MEILYKSERLWLVKFEGQDCVTRIRFETRTPAEAGAAVLLELLRLRYSYLGADDD